MSHRNRRSWAAVVPAGVALLLGVIAQAQPMTLAKRGEPKSVIVVADDAPLPVRFAGEELARFLKQMTGGEFRIVARRPVTGSAIVLGDCPEARKAGIDVSGLDRDGYVIRTVGNALFIVGKDDKTEEGDIERKLAALPEDGSYARLMQGVARPLWDFDRGTLYGTYRFLEELGVRWFIPGPTGTVVPRKKDVSIPSLSLREEPFFKMRLIGSNRWFPSKDRPNPECEDIGWTAKSQQIWLLRQRMSTGILPLNHWPNRLGWAHRFDRSHPEYFALLPNGKRDINPGQASYRAHLCYTNPDVFRITLEDVDAFVQGQPARSRGLAPHILQRFAVARGWPFPAWYGSTVSLLPHDSYRPCHCPTCQPLLDTGQKHGTGSSELVWQFMVKAARELQKRHPRMRVTCLSYSSFKHPPKTLGKLPANLTVGIVSGRLSSRLDEASYREFMDRVREWDAATEGPLAFWLHHLFRYKQPQYYGVPMYVPHFLSRLFKDLSRHGRWMKAEEDFDNAMFEHINRYVMQRLCYDPALDIDALLDDYFKNFYGPAAGVVRSVMDDIEQRCAALGRTGAGRIEVWEKHFPGSVLKDYRTKADEAVRLTKNTRHADAARLFARHYIGLMEKGYAQYDKEVRQILLSGKADIPILRTTGTIRIDGDLSEPDWQKSSVRNFVHYITGEAPRYPTEIRLLWDPKALYFAYTCFDAETMKRSMVQGETNTVEFFLDPQYDHKSYCQIMIDMAGRKVFETFYPGDGRPADHNWQSRVEASVKRHDGKWIVEIALPRKNLPGGLDTPKDRPWGANFGRSLSMKDVRNNEQRFSCFSPILRGRFHQPELFGRMFFQE